MKVVKGNPVAGADFWPRPDIVEELCRTLIEDRGSRRMFGLRRIGKTSILLELERRLADKSVRTIRVDLQGLTRVRDFLGKVLERLPKDGPLTEAHRRIGGNSFIKMVLPALAAKFAGTQPASQTADFVNEMNHHAVWHGDVEDALREAGGVVMLIDELPFMLRDMLRNGYSVSDVERFLAMLRNWRFNCGVRMVLTGSLGLHQLQRNEKVRCQDHVGDLPPVNVPPLERAQAIAMVEALANGERVADWPAELSEAVVDASAETWPIFLQYGFDAVWHAGVRDPAQVKAIVEAQVRQTLDETFYSQFSTRLAGYEGDEKPARVVLKTIVASWPGKAGFDAVDAALEARGWLERRDDLLEALREDDLLLFDTEAQTIWPASRLVVNWVRARPWGR